MSEKPLTRADLDREFWRIVARIEARDPAYVREDLLIPRQDTKKPA